ncbi:MAG: peptide-methionine (R)-S-oxide reductase MsrB [Flavobacterium sp.]|nr:peptide-methionine (R)-S-oxide reductase MsrB [Flavobacterium sp.]
MKLLILLLLTFTITSCEGQQKKRPPSHPVEKTEAQWKKQLTPEQFHVLREKGTERPFSGEYVDNFETGTYVCAACNNVLFESATKFESDCGWPSFDKAIDGSVDYHNDSSFGMTRTEVTCASCGGHLGHVFDDGPKETTGKRYCTNSVAIKFIPKT